MPGPWEKFGGMSAPVKSTPSTVPFKSPNTSSPMTVTGMTMSGPQMTNIPAVAQEAGARAGASTAASESVKQALENKQYQDLFNQVSNLGKPLGELSFEDVYKATKNAKMSKDFVDLRNAFAGKEINQDKYLKTAMNVAQSLLDEAKNIPAEPGIYGRYPQAFINKASQTLGQLPSKDIFDIYAKLSAPLLRRGFGDVGNMAQQEQVMAIDALNSLGHPQKEVREKSQKFLENFFTNISGKSFKFNNIPFKSSDENNLKDIPTETLLKLLEQ